MKELGPDAKRLLGAAARLDAAPEQIQRRMRQRVLGSVAAGAVTTSAFVAKGAVLGTATTTATAAAGTTVVASSVSLVTGFLGAAAVGLGLGTAALVATHAVVVAPSSAVVHVGATAPHVSNYPAGNVHPQDPTLPLEAVRTQEANEERLPVAPGLENEATLPHVTTATNTPNGALKGHSSSNSRNERGISVARREPEGSRALGHGNVSTGTGDFSAVAKPDAASIVQETAILASVQRAIRRGNPSSALTALEQYRVQFPAGALQEEATASRIVALCGLGRTEEGQRLSADFLRRFPSSPLSAHVQAACLNGGASSSTANQ